MHAGARRACGRTWSRTAATSSCWGSRTASPRLRLEGSCKSCRASSSTLELAVRQALEEAAPGPGGHGRGGRRRGGARRGNHRRAAAGVERRARAGTRLDVGARPTPGGATRCRGTCRSSSRTSTARCSPIATRARAVAAPSTAARSTGRAACPGCGRSYFLPQAGRSMDDERLQLAARAAAARGTRRSGSRLRSRSTQAVASRRRGAAWSSGPARRCAQLQPRGRSAARPTTRALRPLRHERARPTTATC